MAHYAITTKAGRTYEFDTDLSLELAYELIKRDLAAKALAEGFASDLCHAYEIKRLSDAQRLWILKLAADLQAEAVAPASPFQPIVDALARMQDGRKARVTLHLQGLTLKFCSTGNNAGGISLTRGDAYLGKLTKTGRLFLSGSLGDQGTLALEQQLADIAADPQAAAIHYGRTSGRCACCNRDLSNPVSLFGGIGPVCLERLAGSDARRRMEADFKASQLLAAAVLA
jgi:hypothetical protein